MTNKFTLNLKTAISVVVLFLTFSLSVNAQEKVQEGAIKVTAHMKTQLSLNDGQYSRVLAINKDYLQKVSDNSGATTVEKAKKKKAYDEERDEKLKSVLNDTQYKIYIANRSANARVYKEVTAL